MTLPSIMTPDGRRAWAFFAIVGGCIVFTGFAAMGVYLVRSHPEYAFLLAIAAHVQVFMGTGALGWVLGRRMVSKVNRDGVEIDDKES